MIYDKDKNLIPLFLKIYKPLNILVGLLFILILILFFILLNPKENENDFTFSKTQGNNLNDILDQNAYEFFKNFLNQKYFWQNNLDSEDKKTEPQIIKDLFY
jgi:hypothetical protein